MILDKAQTDRGNCIYDDFICHTGHSVSVLCRLPSIFLSLIKIFFTVNPQIKTTAIASINEWIET